MSQSKSIRVQTVRLHDCGRQKETLPNHRNTTKPQQTTETLPSHRLRRQQICLARLSDKEHKTFQISRLLVSESHLPWFDPPHLQQNTEFCHLRRHQSRLTDEVQHLRANRNVLAARVVDAATGDMLMYEPMTKASHRGTCVC